MPTSRDRSHAKDLIMYQVIKLPTTGAENCLLMSGTTRPRNLEDHKQLHEDNRC